MSRRRDEAGQASVLIVGFALILLLVIAVAVDSTAAYVQRQGLDTLADGAALSGADAGATGEEVYADGVPLEGRLQVDPGAARAAVARHVAESGAASRYPGLRWTARVEAATVTVQVEAPVDLPLQIPGAPLAATVGATGSAVVDPD